MPRRARRQSRRRLSAHTVVIAGFKSAAVALPIKARRDLVAKRLCERSGEIRPSPVRNASLLPLPQATCLLIRREAKGLSATSWLILAPKV